MKTNLHKSAVLLLVAGTMLTSCEHFRPEPPPVVEQPTYKPMIDFDSPEWKRLAREYSNYINSNRRRSITIDGKRYYRTGTRTWESNPKKSPDKLSYMGDLKIDLSHRYTLAKD